MSEIILDAATAATVAKAPLGTRVCDPEGRTMGYVVSPELYKQVQATIDEAFSDITQEEVNETLADPRRHTTEEVFKLLKGN